MRGQGSVVVGVGHGSAGKETSRAALGGSGCPVAGWAEMLWREMWRGIRLVWW